MFVGDQQHVGARGVSLSVGKETVCFLLSVKLKD